MMRSLVGLILVFAMTVMGTAAEKQKQPAFVDPAEAGHDFQVQGEYLGKVKTDEGPATYGVQVIALGDGKFDAVAYPGGLPGAKGDVSEKTHATGKTIDGATTFAAEDQKCTGTLRGNTILIEGPQGDELGTLEKVNRVSPTLGAKPPQAALVLFDGTGTEHWVHGQMTDDGLLKVGTQTNEKFKDFTLHLEFRTPFMPYSRGQGRGNSGMYLQGRYEVQILDSFGLEGKDNECGGIYKVAAPRVNMCLPPLSWQTYDVDFTAAKFDESGEKTQNARATVRQNGVVIHDNLEIPEMTPGGVMKSESPEPGPLFLQDHGNPVNFRNIWVVEKK